MANRKSTDKNVSTTNTKQSQTLSPDHLFTPCLQNNSCRCVPTTTLVFNLSNLHEHGELWEECVASKNETPTYWLSCSSSWRWRWETWGPPPLSEDEMDSNHQWQTHTYFMKLKAQTSKNVIGITVILNTQSCKIKPPFSVATCLPSVIWIPCYLFATTRPL